MTHQINLAEIDSDGAVREAAHEVAGDTRLGFLEEGGTRRRCRRGRRRGAFRTRPQRDGLITVRTPAGEIR